MPSDFIFKIGTAPSYCISHHILNEIHNPSVKLFTNETRFGPGRIINNFKIIDEVMFFKMIIQSTRALLRHLLRHSDLSHKIRTYVNKTLEFCHRR